jgi:hypothetical protein
MARFLAKKHKYQIKANQVLWIIKFQSLNDLKSICSFEKELFSHGLINVVASCFQGFPGCVGLSRCAILDSVGGRTQVNGIFASIIVLIVILFLGPLFESLPNACLASIIVIALKNMVMEVYTIFPKTLKKSKLEGVIKENISSFCFKKTSPFVKHPNLFYEILSSAGL